jgi:glycosyltransferase involved in cell wall biosynthesis
LSVFYFNRLPVTGPWGGGNKTLAALVTRLTALGHIVTDRPRMDVSVIFCFDPRPSSSGMSHSQLIEYSRVLGGVPIIQRVGDVGTHGKPELTQLVRSTAQRSNLVIFTSHWARDLVGLKGGCRIIPNGALPTFYQHRRDDRPPASRPRIVTHHWSNNPLKGIDLYERLYREIQSSNLEFEFTYIGRSSPTLLPCTLLPMNEEELALELPRHDIYLSASQLEAGANHIVEAMACGLPVVYHRDGGSIPEYCGGRGVQFRDFEEMVSSLRRVAVDHRANWEQVQSYTRSMEEVVDQYLEVLCAE